MVLLEITQKGPVSLRIQFCDITTDLQNIVNSHISRWWISADNLRHQVSNPRKNAYRR